MENNKLFDLWNEKKKSVDSTGIELESFPQRKEVWMCFLGKNIGFEQNGGEDFSRPVLVIKKFNNHIFWVAPLSTKQKSLDFYYNFTDVDNNKVSVILAQLRLIDIKRFKRKMYLMDTAIFAEIREKIRKFI